MRRLVRGAILLVCATAPRISSADAALSPEEARTALRRAVDFFQKQVAVEGGYVWRYSADLTRREGEGKAGPAQIWVQPPGTPYVGEAFLDAYAATGEAIHLEAAQAAAHALVRGQLASGGWDYSITFDPAQRKQYAYRVDATKGSRNVSTLDDDTTQAALRFLMKTDRALAFGDAAVHGAALYALDKLAGAQYPNGAWPQRFSGPPDPAQHPVRRASYPESWSRDYPARDYTRDYTFNDNCISDTIDTMLLAREIYGDRRWRDAAIRGGDFILLAQMPDPQPGWAQQYDAAMHPSWARKFEPPAICGNESQTVMLTLIRLFHATGERRFLEALPKAVAYFRASLLPDGRLARFYELQTNRPLFFTKDYKLTYESNDLPTHYGFFAASRLDQIEAAYLDAQATGAKPHRDTNDDRPGTDKTAREARAAEVLKAMDARGAWIEPGRLRYHGEDDPTDSVIDSTTFARNVRILCDYLGANR